MSILMWILYHNGCILRLHSALTWNFFNNDKIKIRIDERDNSLVAKITWDYASNYQISLNVKAVTYNDFFLKKGQKSRFLKLNSIRLRGLDRVFSKGKTPFLTLFGVKITVNSKGFLQVLKGSKNPKKQQKHSYFIKII